MHTYHIVQKIRTTAYLYEPQTVHTFAIENFDRALPQSGLWIATEVAEGLDLLTAANTSRQRLLPVLTALSFVLQSEFSVQSMSWLAYRLDENPADICYIKHIRAAHSNGMPFWTKDQLSDVEQLLSAQDDIDPLSYFRDANRAVTTSSSLAMYTIAAEGMAGQISKTVKCENPLCGKERTFGGTDKHRLEAILGVDAYGKLYRDHGSLRNKLMHGHTIDENEAGRLASEAYENIQSYIVSKYGLNSVKPITNAPRRFESNQWFGAFLKCNGSVPPTLPQIESGWAQVGQFVDEPVGY